jgi:hypothetical protein
MRVSSLVCLRQWTVRIATDELPERRIMLKFAKLMVLPAS